MYTALLHRRGKSTVTRFINHFSTSALLRECRSNCSSHVKNKPKDSDVGSCTPTDMPSNTPSDASGATKNSLFQRPKRYDTNPRVVLGFIPKSFFDFFYEKTGVTGGYMFFVGVGTYLISKEIYVFNVESVVVMQYALISFFIQRYIPEIKAICDRGSREHAELLDDMQVRQKRAVRKGIQDIEKYKWQLQGIIDFLFPAKKENVYLQMEAVHRVHLRETYLAVKSRLDYFAAKEELLLKYAAQNLFKWIEYEISKSITADVKARVMKKSIADLKNLAKTA